MRVYHDTSSSTSPSASQFPSLIPWVKGRRKFFTLNNLIYASSNYLPTQNSLLKNNTGSTSIKFEYSIKSYYQTFINSILRPDKYIHGIRRFIDSEAPDRACNRPPTTWLVSWEIFLGNDSTAYNTIRAKITRWILCNRLRRRLHIKFVHLVRSSTSLQTDPSTFTS